MTNITCQNLLVKIAGYEPTLKQVNEESKERQSNRGRALLAGGAALGVAGGMHDLNRYRKAGGFTGMSRGASARIAGSHMGKSVLGGVLLGAAAHGAQRLVTPKALSDARSAHQLRKEHVKKAGVEDYTQDELDAETLDRYNRQRSLTAKINGIMNGTFGAAVGGVTGAGLSRVMGHGRLGTAIGAAAGAVGTGALYGGVGALSGNLGARIVQALTPASVSNRASAKALDARKIADAGVTRPVTSDDLRIASEALDDNAGRALSEYYGQ